MSLKTVQYAHYQEDQYQAAHYHALGKFLKNRKKIS